MIERFKGTANIIRFCLLLVAVAGVYLMVAWASYSPLDSGWTVASSVASNTLNKTGAVGAWIIDLLLAMLGHIAFIVPLACITVPAYLLLKRQDKSLNGRQVGGWIASFSVMIVGLAGLASVLFSNTAAYLSGGVLGAMQSALIGEYLGLFGTLFIAMLLTAIGFYFCSGQIILQLATRLYCWIVEEKSPRPSELATQNVVEENREPVVEEVQEDIPLEETQELAVNLTDVSKFTRPNITGLREPREVEPNQSVSDFPHAQSIPFNVSDEIKLPNVSVPTSVFSSLEIFEPHTTELARDLPTIRLNPVEANNQTDLQKNEVILPLVENDKASRPDFSHISEPTTQIVIPETLENDKRAVSIDEDEPIVNMPKVDLQPEFLKPSMKMIPPDPVEPETALPVTPRVERNHLIHPLLQTAKKLDKPTTPLPTLDLLEEHREPTNQITEQEIIETSAKIEQELANFGVKATVEDVLVGPVVTRYEIKPAAGVKSSKITNLDSDLARALIFKAIRITDVVPGKPFMGIETPNSHRETVWLRDVLASDAFRNSNATLPMALGKNISGDPVVVDMAKMPHLLVAGQTGGGKSVGVNTMILSLLYKLTPEQLRFIMIDPKVVELSVYNDIPHLLTPVVTDMKKAENALRWAVEEMERRYLLVSSLGVRNIEGFNSKIDQAAEMAFPIPNPLWRPGDTMDALPPPLEKLPYIVLIVDEFADLMMSAGKPAEDHITRIAQKARAVGIHLILATQRPSTDVITGTIKANIPSRIAFTVASQIDSRTILDKGGAESLLGRGDMLYSGAGSPEIIRVHGAFMSDDDVIRVADNWRARGKPHYIESIVGLDAEEEAEGGERGLADLDPLFDDVTQYVIDSGVTSISGIQRRFSIGFTRAGRIVDQLQDQGIVSAADERNRREVLAR